MRQQIMWLEIAILLITLVVFWLFDVYTRTLERL